MTKVRRDVYYWILDGRKVFLYDIDTCEPIRAVNIPAACRITPEMAESYAISEAAAEMDISATVYKRDYLPLFEAFEEALLISRFCEGHGNGHDREAA